MSIYVFSGLGADERVFSEMTFGGKNVIHVKWISPVKEESISDYAKRISTVIKEPDPVLIGYSFGGLIAIEISKLMPVKKIILLASVKNQT